MLGLNCVRQKGRRSVLEEPTQHRGPVLERADVDVLESEDVCCAIPFIMLAFIVLDAGHPYSLSL